MALQSAVVNMRSNMARRNLDKIRNNQRKGLGSLGRFRIVLLDYLTKIGMPVSTSMIFSQVKAWPNVGVGYPKLVRILFDLKDKGYLVLINRKNGRYWIPSDLRQGL